MHTRTYFEEVVKIAEAIDMTLIEKLAGELAALRERGEALISIAHPDFRAELTRDFSIIRRLESGGV